jgi:uncharacterized protein (UPF0335 family)
MTIANSQPAGDVLRSLIERQERILAEIKEQQLDLKDVANEAKSQGFDQKIIKRVIRLRAMDKNKRFEERSLEEVYMAAIGDGMGSLGDMARDWLDGKRKLDDDGDDSEASQDGAPTKGAAAVDEGFGDDVSDAPLTVDDARRLGAEAAKAGKPVTANPFKAGDDKRAAWDESWCGSIGSDGMDIPDELKPTPKPKKADKVDDDANGGGK